jgi:cytochrome c oxidase subunit 4
MSHAHTAAHAAHNPTDPHAEEGHDSGHGEGHGHVVSPRLLVAVFAGLILLTGVTVGVSYAESSGLLHLGNLSIWVALLIAVAKAGLVAMYFMHLRWDSPFNGMVLIVALLFVAIFIGFAVLDTQQYRHTYENPGSGRMMDLGYGR